MNEKEGWQEQKQYSQKVYHYIVGSFSLCRKLGFYFGDVMPWTGNSKSSEDCAACYRLAEKRNKQPTAAEGQNDEV